jgi:hypothetical protein
MSLEIDYFKYKIKYIMSSTDKKSTTDNINVDKLLKIAQSIADDNIKKESSTNKSSLMVGDLGKEINDIIKQEPVKQTVKQPPLQLKSTTTDQSQNVTKPITNSTPTTNPKPTTNPVVKSTPVTNPKPIAKPTPKLIAKHTVIQPITFASGPIMGLQLCGLNIPIPTLILIILTIVIALVLFYLTSSKKIDTKKKKETKNKKDSEDSD